ncbi:MAG: hypothetical protein ACFFA6_17580 [Promethearchaeota archaeon]
MTSRRVQVRARAQIAGARENPLTSAKSGQPSRGWKRARHRQPTPLFRHGEVVWRQRRSTASLFATRHGDPGLAAN